LLIVTPPDLQGRDAPAHPAQSDAPSPLSKAPIVKRY